MWLLHRDFRDAHLPRAASCTKRTDATPLLAAVQTAVQRIAAVMQHLQLLLLLLPAAVASDLCAIGDFHGDEAHAFDALRLCGAVDASGRWAGGTMTVVQLGDVMDRGNASLPLLHSLWDLQAEAHAAGGELLLLLGNHELLNMQGATRYVHKGELRSYGGAAAWSRAMDPHHGEIGRRLVATPATAVRGAGACATLFLHAGLRPSVAASFESLESLNGALRQQILAGNGELLDAHQGPLWWRGHVRPHAAGLSDESACDEVRKAASVFGAARTAVGHNIVPFVSTRCGGALQMLDVGMSSAYEGRPAAWRCSLDAATGAASTRALYAAGEEPPPDLCDACAQIGRAGHRPSHSLRGDDPHGDCYSYCPRAAASRSLGAAATGTASVVVPAPPTAAGSSSSSDGGGGSSSGGGLASFFAAWRRRSAADGAAATHAADSQNSVNAVKTEF